MNALILVLVAIVLAGLFLANAKARDYDNSHLSRQEKKSREYNEEALKQLLEREDKDIELDKQ